MTCIVKEHGGSGLFPSVNRREPGRFSGDSSLEVGYGRQLQICNLLAFNANQIRNAEIQAVCATVQGDREARVAQNVITKVIRGRVDPL